jgi:hypothetical protein
VAASDAGPVMREVSCTSTGIWYETDSGFFVQLPYPPPASELPKMTAAEQLEWGLRYLSESYGPRSWETYNRGAWGMSRRAIEAQFTDPDEWTAEVARDKLHVERGIIRATKQSRPIYNGSLTRVSVVATVLVEGRLVRLEAIVGDLWGNEIPDRQVVERADAILEKIADILEPLGLEIRAGVWTDA